MAGLRTLRALLDTGQLKKAVKDIDKIGERSKLMSRAVGKMSTESSKKMDKVAASIKRLSEKTTKHLGKMREQFERTNTKIATSTTRVQGTIKRESDRIANLVKTLSKRLTEVTNKQTKKIEASNRRLRDSFRKTKESVNASNRSMERQTRRSMTRMRSSVHGSLADMRGYFGAFITFYSGLHLSRAVLSTAASFQRLEESLKAFVQQDMGKFEQTWGNILKLTRETPPEIEQVTKAMQRYMQVGLSVDEANHRLKQSLDVAASSMLPYGEGLERVTKFLQRAYAGFVELQDVELLETAGIPFTQFLKDVYGVGRRGLKDIVAGGGGAAALGDQFLDYFGERYEGLANKMMETLSGTWARLRNTTQITFKEIGDAASDGMAKLGKSIEGMLTNNTEELRELGRSMGEVGKAIGGVVEWANKNPGPTQMFFKAFTSLVGILAAGAVGAGVVAALKGVASAFKMIGTAILAFKGADAFVALHNMFKLIAANPIIAGVMYATWRVLKSAAAKQSEKSLALDEYNEWRVSKGLERVSERDIGQDARARLPKTQTVTMPDGTTRVIQTGGAATLLEGQRDGSFSGMSANARALGIKHMGADANYIATMAGQRYRARITGPRELTAAEIKERERVVRATRAGMNYFEVQRQEEKIKKAKEDAEARADLMTSLRGHMGDFRADAHAQREARKWANMERIGNRDTLPSSPLRKAEEPEKAAEDTARTIEIYRQAVEYRSRMAAEAERALLARTSVFGSTLASAFSNEIQKVFSPDDEMRGTSLWVRLREGVHNIVDAIGNSFGQSAMDRVTAPIRAFADGFLSTIMNAMFGALNEKQAIARQLGASAANFLVGGVTGLFGAGAPPGGGTAGVGPLAGSLPSLDGGGYTGSGGRTGGWDGRGGRPALVHPGEFMVDMQRKPYIEVKQPMGGEMKIVVQGVPEGKRVEPIGSRDADGVREIVVGIVSENILNGGDIADATAGRFNLAEAAY